jgi:HD-GYP domain-containing protein (c-di-GMP phosphodiesterase class II)
MPRLVMHDGGTNAAAAAKLLASEFDVRPWAETSAAGGGVVALVEGEDIGAGEGLRLVGVVDEADAGPWPSGWYAVVPVGAPHEMLARVVRNAFADLDGAIERARLERELSELNAIGIRLSAERDPAALLETILSKAREITRSDAGSLYLVEPAADGSARLRFALAQNDSIEIPFQTATLALTGDSVAGHVALTGETLNLPDAYAPPPGSRFQVNRWFDDRARYRTKSMLVVPMRTPQGETIGVLQLINAKPGFTGRLTSAVEVDRHVQPFDVRAERLTRSLASQAAVALHSSRLYASIYDLFEGFVKASVTAIEARDPSTFGHSFRVAELTVALAEAVDRTERGPYAATRFTPEEVRELRYAALLHDFGKVGVREHLLVKPKKLHATDLQRIRHRMELLMRDLELAAARRKLDLLARGGPGFADEAARVDADLGAALAELRGYVDVIETANEPSMLPHDFASELMRITARSWSDQHGRPRTVITPEEATLLAITRGSLTHAERRDVQQHVMHTFQFLAQIPWTSDLRRIPEIARAHHEKLDGSGYPFGIRADEIPVQSRMLTIADIYDALTATDRPYKKAVRVAEALELLNAERRAGTIDGDLLDVFIAARVYERTAAG